MDNFTWGLIVGTIFGLALAIVVARLAGSMKWVAGLLGYSEERKKIRDLENRLAEKDRWIRKAIKAYGDEGKLPEDE